MNMLGLAKRVKARILQASTSEVYGDPEVSPQPEEYWGKVNCNGVRSCYDEGKRAAETLCFDYHRQNGPTPPLSPLPHAWKQHIVARLMPAFILNGRFIGACALRPCNAI